MPRVACTNLSARMGIPRFHRLFAAAGRPGAYPKVLQPGALRAGDVITVERRPDNGTTIGEACRR